MKPLLIFLFLLLCHIEPHAETIDATSTSEVEKLHQVGAEIGRQGCRHPNSVRNTSVKSESDNSVIGTVKRTTCSEMVLWHFKSNEPAFMRLTSLRILKPHKLLPHYARIGSARSEIEAKLGPPVGDTLPPEVRESIGVKDLNAIYYTVPEEGPDDHIIVFFFKGDRLAQVYWSFIK